MSLQTLLSTASILLWAAGSSADIYTTNIGLKKWPKGEKNPVAIFMKSITGSPISGILLLKAIPFAMALYAAYTGHWGNFQLILAFTGILGLFAAAWNAGQLGWNLKL